MVGLAAGHVEVQGIGEDGVATGVLVHPAAAGDGPGLPTMTPLDVGIAVVWQSSSSGTCRLAKLGADLAVVAGPVDMNLPGCADPHVAWLPDARRIIVVSDDPGAGGIAGAGWGDALVPRTPPTPPVRPPPRGRVVRGGA